MFRSSHFKARFSRENVDPEFLDVSVWPRVDESSIEDPGDRKTFIDRCISLNQYINTDKQYKSDDLLSSNEMIRIFKRCLALHPDGRIYGYRALIPHTRIKTYVRKSTVETAVGKTNGFSGAFTSLLEQHPELHDLIERNVFKKGPKNAVFESRISVKHLHKKFLDMCRDLGLEISKSYPFNTVMQGYGALAKYISMLQQNNPYEAIKANHSKSAAKKLLTSDASTRPVHKAYQRVECDAHHIDAIFCILVPSIFGELIPKIIKRIWVIVVQEVMSRAVLGYYLSLREECSSDDVLEAIKRSLITWKPRKLLIPKMEYNDGAGFPSSNYPRLSGVIWSEFSVDQALANLSERVKAKLKLVSDGACEAIVVNRHVPDDRPFIERFFKTLEESGFHRLPNTTGSDKDDPRRRDPELAACKYFIQLEHLEELTDVIMANYNGTPHTSIGQRTPIEYLNYLTSSEDFDLKYADKDQVNAIMSYRKKIKVSGSLQDGRRPFINFHQVTYSSDAFKRSYHLAGKHIIVEADINDLRTVKAYSENGAELGTLVASPPWHRTPHSLYIRQVICGLVRKKMIHINSSKDPITTYLEYLESNIQKGKAIPPAYLLIRRQLTEDFLMQEIDPQDQGLSEKNAQKKKKAKACPESGETTTNLPPPRKTAFCEYSNKDRHLLRL